MTEGRKRLKGQPEIHNELKKPVAVTLTPTAISYLDDEAKRRGISRSELIEQLAREQAQPREDTLQGFSGEWEDAFDISHGVRFRPLRFWDELPESQGAYLIQVNNLQGNHKLHVRYGSNMRQLFQDEVRQNADFKQYLIDNVDNAFLLWA